MTRKKVKPKTINSGSPKKRKTETTNDNKKEVIKTIDNKPTRWDKVGGVNGKIIRVEHSDRNGHFEMGNLISKGMAREMYVGIDDDKLYHYYEIFKEK